MQARDWMEMRNRAAGTMGLKNKKAQEEIMGFMLIVVMVMVIGLGFLFFFNPKPVETDDLELHNLLYSWLSVTLENSNIEQIIDGCYKCDLSNATNVLDKAMEKISNKVNGYSLSINGTAETYYSKGNLTGKYRSSVALLQNNEIKLRFYYP